MEGGAALQECLCSGHQHLPAQPLLDSSMTIPGGYTHFTDGQVEAWFRETHLLASRQRSGWIRSQNLRFWHVGPALPDRFSAYLHVQVLQSARNVQNETGSWVRHLGCHMPPCVPQGVAQQQVWVDGFDWPVQGLRSIPLLLCPMAPYSRRQPQVPPRGRECKLYPPPCRGPFPEALAACLPALIGKE